MDETIFKTNYCLQKLGLFTKRLLKFSYQLDTVAKGTYWPSGASLAKDEA